jgi:hypothetical protein
MATHVGTFAYNNSCEGEEGFVHVRSPCEPRSSNWRPHAIFGVPGSVEEKVKFVENSIEQATVVARSVFDSINTGAIEEAIVASKVAWGPGTSDMAVENAIMLMASSPHEPQTQDAINEAWGVNIENRPMGGTIKLAQSRVSYGLPLCTDPVTGLYYLSPTAARDVEFQIEHNSQPPQLPKLISTEELLANIRDGRMLGGRVRMSVL